MVQEVCCPRERDWIKTEESEAVLGVAMGP